MLPKQLKFYYVISIVYLNFLFLRIELVVLKGDFVEEGSYLYDVRKTIAWK